MNDFKRGFAQGAQAVGGFAGAVEAGKWVDGVESATDQAAADMRAIAAQYQGVDPHYLKGFLAEAWHAGTFNIDAARRQVEEHARRLALNLLGSPDIQVQGPSGSTDFQLKFYRSPEATAKALSEPQYGGHGKVAPSDQVDGIRAAAEHLAAKNAPTRPAQSAQYADTRDHVSGVVSGDKAASDGLSHSDALAMAKEVKRGEFDPASHGLRIEDQVGFGDVAAQAAQAGAMAAMLGAGSAAVPYVARALKQLVQEGAVDPQLLRDGAWATAKGGAQGAVRGAVAAGIVAAAGAGMLGEAMKTVSPPVIGAVVAVALSTAVDAVALHRGDITPEEFGRRMTTNSIVAAAGTAGAVAGQMLIPVPYLGAIIGGLVGSAVGSVAASGVSAALDRLSNVELAAANAELMRNMLNLAFGLEVAAANTAVVQQAQADFMQTLAASRARWRLEAEAARTHLDQAADLHSQAAALGAEQDRALLAMLAAKG